MLAEDRELLLCLRQVNVCIGTIVANILGPEITHGVSAQTLAAVAAELDGAVVELRDLARRRSAVVVEAQSDPVPD